MTAPSLEELLHLADRAERHALGLVEAASLRRGIAELARLASAAGARARRLQAELAEDAVHSPLRVGCSFCGVLAGSRCRSMFSATPPRRSHTARFTAAGLAGGSR